MEVRTIRTRVTLISEKEPVFRLLKREFFLSYVLLAVQHVIYRHKAFENCPKKGNIVDYSGYHETLG